MNVDIKVGGIEISISDVELNSRQIKNLIAYTVQKSIELDHAEFEMQMTAHSLGLVQGINHSEVEH